MVRYWALVALATGCGVEETYDTVDSLEPAARAAPPEAETPTTPSVRIRCDLDDAEAAPDDDTDQHLADTDNTSCGFLSPGPTHVRSGWQVTRLADGEASDLSGALNGPRGGLLLPNAEEGTVVWVTADGREHLLASGDWRPTGLWWSDADGVIVATHSGRRWQLHR